MRPDSKNDKQTGDKLKELENITVEADLTPTSLLIEEPPLTQEIFDKGRRRQAAVLVLVRYLANEPHLVFMRRTEKVHSHKGQISFPGGGYKAEDGELVGAARRETQEELGISPNFYQVLGMLPPIDTVVSNFMIHPFLAIAHVDDALLNYVPDDFEVAQVLELPLRPLMQPEALQIEEWVIGGKPRQVRFYNYQDKVIWGATAHILQELIRQLEAGKWPEILRQKN